MTTMITYKKSLKARSLNYTLYMFLKLHAIKSNLNHNPFSVLYLADIVGAPLAPVTQFSLLEPLSPLMLFPNHVNLKGLTFSLLVPGPGRLFQLMSNMNAASNRLSNISNLLLVAPGVKRTTHVCI